MAGVKITRFLGIAPRISPELLPDTAAQIARNCKLYSGDLIPYPEPVVVGNTQRTGEIRTLYALRDPVTSELKWLSWANDVNIVVATPEDNADQRFYYTGDGVPKISNYELAVGLTAPYPTSYYDLGLPLPASDEVLTTVAAGVVTSNVSSVSRDASNTATIVTAAPHGLRTGNSISITGFTFKSGTYSQTSSTITVSMTAHGFSVGATVTLNFTTGGSTDGTFTINTATANSFTVTASDTGPHNGNVQLSLTNFNATNVECTVTAPNTFTYFSPGPQMAASALLTGRVTLAGNTQERTYVFTWYTPWEEESVASEPSEELYIKEGQIVTVSNIPTAKPPGNNFVRGVRLYRTLPAATGTEFYLLQILWFPTELLAVQRTSNVSRVTTLYPHNLDPESRFKISGCSNASFDIVDGEVIDVIDQYTFTYAQTDTDVGLTTVGAGTLYYDVSEDPANDAARYWGDGGNYDFIDDFESTALTEILTSDEYDAPPDDLKGLIAIQNNILVGFVDNTIYFSEPSLPHAWPREYSIVLEHQVVGLAVINGALLVLTESYPYIISGSDPASGMSVNKVDAQYPCLSARSIVPLSYGVLFATHGGLAAFSPFGGPQIATKFNYNDDTWEQKLDPTTIVASFYDDTYFASHSTGAFVFERDERIGGLFVDCNPTFTAAWYDSLNGNLYYVSGTSGDVYEWDNLNQPPLTMEWKSKVIVTKDMINLGAARVVADYPGTASTTELWEDVTANWNTTTLGWSGLNDITFRMWADKQLIYTTTLSNSDMFRLPTGFRTDTFEFGIEGNIRIRAIHLAETPLGLKEA